jgi:hypothetical protein
MNNLPPKVISPTYARLRLAETLLEQVYRQVGFDAGGRPSNVLTPRLRDSIKSFINLPKLSLQESKEQS